MNTQVRPRDIKLLLILVVLIILIIPFFFLIQPQLEKNQKLEEELKSLQTRKTYLNQLADQSQEYLASAESLGQAKLDIINKFPSELPKEASIMFIHETEKVVPIRLNNVTFGVDVAAQIVSDEEEKQIDAVEEATGDKTNDEVIEENTTTVQLSSGLSGISTETQFTFSAGYQDFKNFMLYIREYKDRMVIHSMSMTYSAETDKVTGDFNLVQYAVGGADREPVSFEEPSMMKGTTNIFMQATGNYGQAQDVETTDFFLMLSQPDAGADAKIVGRAQDPTEATYLKSDANSEQEVTVTFEGDNGNYTAVYQIGKTAYEEPVEFSKNSPIIFEIISSPRVGNQDKVAAKVSIINHTDQTVTVSVVNDDPENPRVDIVGRTGTIVMK